jgi:hypothetical protein
VRKLLLLAFVFAVTIPLTACATIFKGDTQNINMSSEPSGAEIFIDGVSYGRTPISVQLKVDRSYTVTMRHDGQQRTVILNNKIGPLWVVLDIVSGIGPLIIDAATGAWYELEPDQVVVNFD